MGYVPISLPQGNMSNGLDAMDQLGAAIEAMMKELGECLLEAWDQIAEWLTACAEQLVGVFGAWLPGARCRFCGRPRRVTRSMTCVHCGGPDWMWTPAYVRLL